MPELPDLHVFAVNLNKLALTAPITSAVLHETRKNTLPPAMLSEACVGARIAFIAREGKELLFTLDNGHSFAVHLMLNGKIELVSEGSVAKVRSKIVSLTFADARALVFTDFSSMCKVTLDPKKSNVPDAMSDAFDEKFLMTVLAKHARKTIKELLITPGIVRGIGNAYADEILYEAGVSPLSYCGSIPDDAARDIHSATKKVLAEAIETITKLSPDRISGEERSFLKVHKPDLKQTAKGEEVLHAEIGGRHTYYARGQRTFM